MLIKISKTRVKEIIAEEIDRARQNFLPDLLSEGLYDTVVGKGISWSEFSPVAVRQKVATAFGIETRMDKSAAANTELENAIKDKSEDEIRAAMSGQSPGTTDSAEDDSEQEKEAGSEEVDTGEVERGGAGTGGRGRRARKATTHDDTGTTKRRKGGKKWVYKWRGRSGPEIDRDGENRNLRKIKLIFKTRQQSVPEDLDAIKARLNKLVINPVGIGRRGKAFSVRPTSPNIDKYLKIVMDNFSGFTLEEDD